MKILSLIILVSIFAIKLACLAQTPEKPAMVVLPGEKLYPEGSPNPTDEVRLRVSAGYIAVRVEEREKGLILFLGHRMSDGKPNQSLQERTVTVHLNHGKKKRKLRMRNLSGSLSSRQPLPDADSWNLTIDLKGVRSGIDDDKFEVEFKRAWVKRWKKPSLNKQPG